MVSIETNNKGDKNNLYCFLSCVLSRLAYLKMPEFYQKYIMIMNTLPKINLNNITDLSTIFDSKYDIDLVKLNLPQKITHIIIDQNMKNLQQVKDKNVKVIEITNSNGNKVYIVGDRNINTIFVLFRGTDSFKAMSSWLQLHKNVPIYPCNNSKIGFIMNMFKLEIEIIHTLFYSICYLSNTFLKKIATPATILTTGHSLGGGLCTIFSYLWTGLRNANIDNLTTYINKQIICISVASPRVFNEYMVKNDLYKLIDTEQIIYKRIISIGDAVTYQPIYLNEPINKNSALFCTNTNKINHKNIDYKRPLICSYTEPENSPKNSILAHGNYMYINFSGDTYKTLFSKRELLPSKYSTIVKLFVAFTNETTNQNEYRLLFFNLNDIRYGINNNNILNSILKFIKVNVSEKEDKYMTWKLFNHLIENTKPFNEIVKQIQNNIISKTTHFLISHGRPIFDIKQAIIDLKLDKIKPTSFQCITSSRINKFVKTRKRENKNTKTKRQNKK